jgi:hypothetical protein
MALNLAALAKQIGPEAFHQFSGMVPEMADLLQDGKGGVPKVDKSAAVSAAVQNLLAPQPLAEGEQPKSGIDKLQAGLDIAGIVDPTPTLDAINMGISLVRAAQAKTPDERSGHMKNAIISGVSMLPYVGDLAKIAKLSGKTGAKVAAKETAIGTDTGIGPKVPPVQAPPIIAPPVAPPVQTSASPPVQTRPPDAPVMAQVIGPAPPVKPESRTPFKEAFSSARPGDALVDQLVTRILAGKGVPAIEKNTALGKALQSAIDSGDISDYSLRLAASAVQPSTRVPPPPLGEIVGAPPAPPSGVSAMITGAASGANAMVTPPPAQEPTSGIDMLQAGLDLAGVADPTPIVDTVNAGISLARAAAAKTPEERKQHLINAAISGVSAVVPYVGDWAKLAKPVAKAGAKAAEKTTAKAVTKEASAAADVVGAAPPIPTAHAAVPETGRSPELAARREEALAKYPNVRRPAQPVSPSAAPTARLGRYPNEGYPGYDPLTGMVHPSSPQATNVRPTATPPLPPPPSPSSARGSPPMPPPPPAGTTSPATPPPVPPGPTPTPVSPTAGLDSLLPLLGGGAAGAVAGMFTGGGGRDFSGPKSHSLTADVAGPSGQVGSEALDVVKNRGKEIFNPLLDPINALLHPISSVTQSLGGMIKAVDEVPSAIMHWGESLTESQRHLQQWSGALANAFQESQVRQIMREFESAGRTSGSTVDLRHALDDLKDELQPMKDLVTNATNRLVTAMVTMADGLIYIGMNLHVIGPLNNSLQQLVDFANRLLGGKPDPSQTAAFELMNNIRNLRDPTTRATKPPRVI